MDITLQPIRIAVGPLNEEGYMVLVDGTLVAVLAHLTGPYDNPHLEGQWIVQMGLGLLSDSDECFPTLREAEDLVLQHYLKHRERASGQVLKLDAYRRTRPGHSRKSALLTERRRSRSRKEREETRQPLHRRVEHVKTRLLGRKQRV